MLHACVLKKENTFGKHVRMFGLALVFSSLFLFFSLIVLSVVILTHNIYHFFLPPFPRFSFLLMSVAE